MRNTALALLVLTLVASPAAAQRKETETVDRTVAFSRGGTLKLKNFSGNVRITGTQGTDVVVHAVRTATRDRLDSIKLDIEVDGSTVSIEANRRSPTGTAKKTTWLKPNSISRSRLRRCSTSMPFQAI
jgi:DUF4097 and DUF4098 domain-containing protein YvlB